MERKEFLNKHLLNGTDILKAFNSPYFVRHIEISSISMSSFTLPQFDEAGNFIGKPTAFREEYIQLVQKSLNGIINPCLYMFELVSPDVQSVFETYKAFADKQDKIKGAFKRSCSAINSSFSVNNREPCILYVGKSEKPIDGRIVVHFGYYEKGVAGLQLVYWGKEIGLKLNLHVFELVSKEIQPYLEVLEKLFFVQLRPIIGKR